MKRIILALLLVLTVTPAYSDNLGAACGLLSASTNVLLYNTTGDDQLLRLKKSALVAFSSAAVVTIADDEGGLQNFGGALAGLVFSELFNKTFYLSTDGRRLSFGFRF